MKNRARGEFNNVIEWKSNLFIHTGCNTHRL
jgi:hypothetical protein